VRTGQKKPHWVWLGESKLILFFVKIVIQKRKHDLVVCMFDQSLPRVLAVTGVILKLRKFFLAAGLYEFPGHPFLKEFSDTWIDTLVGLLRARRTSTTLTTRTETVKSGTVLRQTGELLPCDMLYCPSLFPGSTVSTVATLTYILADLS